MAKLTRSWFLLNKRKEPQRVFSSSSLHVSWTTASMLAGKLIGVCGHSFVRCSFQTLDVLNESSSSPPDSPSCQIGSFHFLLQTPDESWQCLCWSLFSYDTSGRWLTALRKANRWQENISNNHRRQSPRERNLMETDPRQSRRAAVMELVWQTRAAENFDKSLNVTWGLWSWTINQMDGFIQREWEVSELTHCCCCCHHQTSSSTTNSFMSKQRTCSGIVWEIKRLCAQQMKSYLVGRSNFNVHKKHPSTEPNRYTIYCTVHSSNALDHSPLVTVYWVVHKGRDTKILQGWSLPPLYVGIFRACGINKSLYCLNMACGVAVLDSLLLHRYIGLCIVMYNM